MDDGWIGRKTMLASRALAARYAEHGDATGRGGPVVTEIAGSLLREIGRSIALGETDPRLPFARARGVLRLPPQDAAQDLAHAFNALGTLVRDYLHDLPGSTDAHELYARKAVAHAARSAIHLQRLLLAGVRDREAERLFGGVAVLVFHPHEEVENLSA